MMEPKKRSKRISYVIFLSLTAVVFYSLIDPSFYYFLRDFFRDSPAPVLKREDIQGSDKNFAKKEPWITVFVHGSFGSLIGLISFSRVIKDDLYGSMYKDIIKKMRQDPFSFKDQPMLERGLVRINPTFNIRQMHDNKYAAYPIIKAYETIQDIAKPHQEENYFYTFGWSGLMSQHRRRLESIRLYNCLIEEIERLKKKGISPKIRILAHSHGGNLSLNLAAINHVMKGSNPLSFEHKGYHHEVTQSLKEMLELIKKMPHKPQLAKVKGQSRYDYAPINASLHIDELIVLGTPIQPETEFFCLSDTIGAFYHFYSGEDVIQKLDGVTTKQYRSEQRLPSEVIAAGKNKIVQVKIMYGREVRDNKLVSNKPVKGLSVSGEDVSLWHRISGLLGMFSRKAKDPGHKELWFAMWRSDGDPTQILAPLPVVVLTPLIMQALGQAHSDVDVNVAFTKDKLQITTFKHDDNNVQEQVELPLSFVMDLKEKFKPWNPQDLLDRSGIEGIYKHLV